MPDLTLEQLTLASAIVAGLAVIAFFLCIVLAMRIRKLRRDYALLRGEGDEKDIIHAVSRIARRMESIDKRIDEATTVESQHAASARYALQRFAIVRYDAFEDMGGRLSFSAALLDDHGDGLVFSSINGRTETRTYAKPVKSLSSSYNLTEEEREAIAAAMAGLERSDARETAAQPG